MRTSPTWTWLMTSPEESGCTDRTTPRSHSMPSCTAAGTRYFCSLMCSSDECLFIFHLFMCFCLSNKRSGMPFSFQPHGIISFTRSSLFFLLEVSHLTVGKKFLLLFQRSSFDCLFIVLLRVRKLLFQQF